MKISSRPFQEGNCPSASDRAQGTGFRSTLWQPGPGVTSNVLRCSKRFVSSRAAPTSVPQGPRVAKQHPTLPDNSLHIKGGLEALKAGGGAQEHSKAAWVGLAVRSHMVLDCTFPQTSCTSQTNTYWAKLRNASFWRLFPSAHHKGYIDLATLLRSEWKHRIAGKQTHMLLIKAIHTAQKILVWRATSYICTSTWPVLQFSKTKEK